MEFAATEAKMTNIKEQSEGICPSCEAQLELGEGIVEGDTFSRDAKCPQCDFEGKQIYDLVFSEIIEM
jgi:ssDNA-binding Zn-finger/Zn-ribbon topoisomerase 1